ncbi:MAG: hypothetical protein RJA22_2 [Verrucomicrobiota bacterium]
MKTRSFAAGLLLLAGAVLAPAQTDQAIYSDALVNGWENWSWATVNLANTTPVRSGTRSISVNSGAWQAIYLHHAAFNTAGYTTLAFWIHGGASGGQRLQVQALRNGTAQPAVTLAPLTANAWQQIQVSLSSLGVASVADMDGFWIQDVTGTTQPAYYLDDLSLVAVPAPAAVNVSVDVAQVVRTVDNRHFGLNATIWDDVFPTATTVSMLAEMDNRTLRFPGGSLSDEYHWATGTTRNNTWAWATTFDEFASVATATSAQVFITANYGSGTPAEAADWVRYANVTKGYGFKYWEIGNENYGSWEYDLNTRPHDPHTYATRFQQYWTQMKAVDPTIKIGAVVITGEDSYANYTDHPALNPRTGQTHNGWTPVMLATLKSLGVTPDFVVYHRYPQAPGSENDTGLLQSSGTWASDAADLRRQLNDYLGTTTAAGVELICTENNSVYSNPGKQTTSLVNGLFLADSLLQLLHTEFNGFVWWDVRNAQETGNNNNASLYGWRNYGDYGIASAANPAGPADRYPVFHVAKLLQYFARGGDQIVRATSDYVGAAAYAARRADGTVSLLLLNKSPSSTFTVNMSLANYTPAATAALYSYGIPQDEAARTGVGSAEIAQSTVSIPGATFSRSVAPYSATVLHLGGTLPPPPPPPARQPDALVKLSNDAAYLGNNVYNLTGTSQTRSATVAKGKSLTFFFQIQNDGGATDSFTVQGPAGSAGFTVKYLQGSSGSTDITTAVTAGTYAVNNLAASGSQVFRAVITSSRTAALGAAQHCLVTVTSKADTTRKDAAKATATVR